ncbi:predicted protein [Coccidioides posadasii str. Silveira]|uniref:Predicted protein n=2 Tax=Coccidioides posadasii TaxID=199306 RepID=E9DJG2_COCPS|nr:predicted protein [Coccidioides posadasii str. Silveira]KMM64707.1 hypothetical protein CPAG_01059 [Coccidioides posadasii RMSCC 3488]
MRQLLKLHAAWKYMSSPHDDKIRSKPVALLEDVNVLAAAAACLLELPHPGTQSKSQKYCKLQQMITLLLRDSWKNGSLQIIGHVDLSIFVLLQFWQNEVVKLNSVQN